jgi:uncharacterized membrane protein
MPTHPAARDRVAMSNLIGIAYPDEATAKEVARTLSELQKEHSIELDDLVVAVRQDNGKIKLRQSFSPAGSGAAGGALWGGLIGLIFLAPLLGMAIGAASGGAAGALADYGIDDKFMKELGTRLEPGSAALFVLVRSSTPDKVLPRVYEFGGEVLHTSLSTEAEETLRETLAEGAAHAGAAQQS